MTKRIADYDPYTKTTTFFEYDQLTDTSIITTHQDVETSLEWTKALARDDSYSKKGIKKGMWHYATIPDVIWLEILTKHGVDWNDTKAVRRCVDIHYPHLKTTTKKHT